MRELKEKVFMSLWVTDPVQQESLNLNLFISLSFFLVLKRIAAPQADVHAESSVF